MALSGAATEIDNDQISIVFADPAPCHEIPKALVVGPTGTLAKAPLTIPKHRALDGFQELPVESAQFLVCRLDGAPA